MPKALIEPLAEHLRRRAVTAAEASECVSVAPDAVLVRARSAHESEIALRLTE